MVHPPAVLDEISDWFEAAVPDPNEKSLHTQLGVHFEEVAEMLACLESNDEKTIDLISQAQVWLETLATHLKTNSDIIAIGPDNRVPLLDALCDQMVTAIGVGHMMDFETIGGLEEVSASNWSKFDDNGKPIFNEDMKIQKGPMYFKANLEEFV